MDSTEIRQELDPTVKSALNQMLLAAPSSEEQHRSLARIKRGFSSKNTTQEAIKLPDSAEWWSFGWLEFAAACVLGVALSLVASTEAWAQVTRDFANPLNEPKPITTASEANPSPPLREPPSFGTRLVLLSHVGLLLIGLCGMAASWCLSFAKYFLGDRTSPPQADKKASLEHRLLARGLLLYACGTAIGTVWSQITWGSFWQWSPQEVFCLLTLAVGLLWIGLPCTGSAPDSTRVNNAEAAKQMSLRTIAFGTIFSMVPVASNFAALQSAHSYGASSGFAIVLTAIAGVVALCIAAIWSFHFLTRRPAGKST